MRLTANILKNESTGYFTAFISEFPGILAQGQSIDEVKTKLDKAFENFLEMTEKQDILYTEPSTM